MVELVVVHLQHAGAAHGSLVPGFRVVAVDLEERPDRVDHRVLIFLRYRVGDDDITVLFPERALRGGEKAVLNRVFMAYRNGHGAFSVTGYNEVLFRRLRRIQSEESLTEQVLCCYVSGPGPLDGLSGA